MTVPPFLKSLKSTAAHFSEACLISIRNQCPKRMVNLPVGRTRRGLLSWVPLIPQQKLPVPVGFSPGGLERKTPYLGGPFLDILLPVIIYSNHSKGGSYHFFSEYLRS